MLSACMTKHDKSSLPQNISGTDSSYIKPTLLNCLSGYIEKYDTVRNSWKISPIYLISFYREGNDTIVYIFGHKIRPIILPPPNNAGLELSGYFFLQDKPIMIVDNIGDIGSHLYVKGKLQKNIETIDKGRDALQFEHKTLPTWVYKVSNKVNLQFIREEKGVILK